MAAWCELCRLSGEHSLKAFVGRKGRVLNSLGAGAANTKGEIVFGFTPIWSFGDRSSVSNGDPATSKLTPS